MPIKDIEGEDVFEACVWAERVIACRSWYLVAEPIGPHSIIGNVTQIMARSSLVVDAHASAA